MFSLKIAVMTLLCLTNFGFEQAVKHLTEITNQRRMNWTLDNLDTQPRNTVKHVLPYCVTVHNREKREHMSVCSATPTQAVLHTVNLLTQDDPRNWLQDSR